KHVPAFHQEHIVLLTLSARLETFAERSRRAEVVLGQTGECQRSQEGRLWLDPKGAGELECALLGPGHPARPIALNGDQRRGQCREDGKLTGLTLGDHGKRIEELKRSVQEANGLGVGVKL